MRKNMIFRKLKSWFFNAEYAFIFLLSLDVVAGSLNFIYQWTIPDYITFAWILLIIAYLIIHRIFRGFK